MLAADEPAAQIALLQRLGAGLGSGLRGQDGDRVELLDPGGNEFVLVPDREIGQPRMRPGRR